MDNLKSTYEINNIIYRRVDVRGPEEYDYLYSNGLATRIGSKNVAYVHTKHYEMAKRLIENKRNPILRRANV